MRSVTDRPTNIFTLNQILSEWGEEWIWDHLELIEGGDLVWLSHAFSNGTALFIGDGSYQLDLCRELAAAACIIECTFTGSRVRYVIQPTTKEHNAYTLDLTGIYNSLAFILEVCSLHGVPNGRVKV